MMLAAILIQTAIHQPAPADDQAITVLARKLRKLQLGLEIHKDRFEGCIVKVSSGDAVVDGIACDVARSCVTDRLDPTVDLMGCINGGIAATIARRRAHEEETNARN